VLISPVEQLKAAVSFFQSSYPSFKPEFTVVLGSGLSDVANAFEVMAEIPFHHVPYLHQTTVEGHSGQIALVNTKKNKQGIIFKGRLHAYEGLDFNEVMFLVRFSKLLGSTSLIVTNAAGSVNLDYHPGDLILIKDHLNVSGKNPLMGKNYAELGPRFTDLSECYNQALREKMLAVASQEKIEVKEGTYAYVMGPTYETPSEIKMYRLLGADMVGMSTVPDVMAAVHGGMQVLGLSCITNYGAGIKKMALKHEDVKIEASKALNKITVLIKNFLDQ
jgi:purine-nucleoside phosphorylase